jgi:BirA family biotin operon repressor/biotin-[acetyl-CoA-carboxylase] ligase
MLNEARLRSRLPIGFVGRVFYFHEEIGSTNSEAMRLAESGSPHGTLVLAESQTSGKGREGRQWITLPGTSLAFSVILHPSQISTDQWLKVVGLGALSVSDTLSEIGLPARIKWPNDVLLSGKKVAGILAETKWVGEDIEYTVLGVGLNVTQDAIPPDAEFDFPATSVAEVLGRSLDREDLFISILENVWKYLQAIDTPDLIAVWQSNLAYLDQEVLVRKANVEKTGRLIGLTQKGELKISESSGREIVIGYGDVRLRPIIKSEGDESASESSQ